MIMKKLKNLFRSLRSYLRMRRTNRLRNRLLREGLCRIQVKEYGGVVHISFDGIPLVDSRYLNKDVDIVDHLSYIRCTYLLYGMDQLEAGLR